MGWDERRPGCGSLVRLLTKDFSISALRLAAWLAAWLAASTISTNNLFFCYLKHIELNIDDSVFTKWITLDLL